MERASMETTQLDAQTEAWFASYEEFSNEPPGRRRARRRRSRGPKRPQLFRRDTVMMVASVVFVGAMTACFYVVLTR